MEASFSERVVAILQAIPEGTVAFYGQIAAMAGNPRAARQVVWVLHASSKKRGLPWHRVVNIKGGISLPVGDGYELQRALLEEEGVSFDDRGRIDLKRFLWYPGGEV